MRTGGLSAERVRHRFRAGAEPLTSSQEREYCALMHDLGEIENVPVAIVGGGVVGLSMAVALARQGVRSVVLERAEKPNDHPRAHVCNPRTLEIFRLWGIEHRVRAAGLPESAMGRFVWRTAIAGEELGEIAYEAHARDHIASRRQATLTPEVSCAQDLVEAILRERLGELTGEHVRFGSNVVRTRDDGSDGVVLSVNDEPDAIRARYVVAADGAASDTRGGLGIPMEGPEQLASFLAIYLYADLSRWTRDRPAVLYWVVNSAVQGVFIAMDGHCRYTFHVRTDCERPSPHLLTIDRCRELVTAAIGAELTTLDIRQVGRWVMSGQVAERYRVGNVLLVGDAAHRFPPTGGFGMNSGIQDAHNLAWKLAAVLAGWAPESLLDSYELERRPVAELYRSRSVSNFRRLNELASWSSNPEPIVRRLESSGEIGKLERARFRQEIENQRDHFDKLNLELGFRYDRGAVVADPGPVLPVPPDGREAFTPRAVAGARAPLVRLQRPRNGTVATTDLFEREFVLLADATGGWPDAVDVVRSGGVPIRCIEIGDDLLDPDGAWRRMYEIELGGAVLVRPDGHVAFRCPRRPDGPTQTLVTTMRDILSTPA
jgi:2-polyprenyl-6-methoxyphenol hydroxylase-like FAD-dependent oxidoreductase